MPGAMDPAEATTALTDLALTMASALLAYRLARAARRYGAVSSAAPFIAAFATSAVAAGAGVFFHGLRSAAPAAVLGVLWWVVEAGIAATGLGLLLGIVRLRCTPGLARILAWIAWLKAIAVAVNAVAHDQLTVVGIDLLATLAIIAAVEIRSALRRQPGALWFLSGTSLTLIAAALQVSGFRHNAAWNHNDAFHLLQIVALWCFHRAASMATGP